MRDEITIFVSEMLNKAKRVHQSYIRAGGKTLVKAFYANLVQASEEIMEKFDHVDMETQIDLLAHAVVMSFLFVDKSHHAATHTLDGVRNTHSRENLDIQPHLYDVWLDCLLDTVKELDPEADEELLQDWYEVMYQVVEHIRSGY